MDFHRGARHDVRYRSLPLLAEMADGFGAPRYGLRPTAGPHRFHAARNGHIVPLPHVRFDAARSAIVTNTNFPLEQLASAININDEF